MASITSIKSPILRIGLIPGAAVGGLLGGALVTNIVNRLSVPRDRQGLFLRRRARRQCARCGGFGISRCTLCSGEGICSYNSDLAIQIPCPLCVMKRYVSCSMCGGNGIRPPAGRRERFILRIRRWADAAINLWRIR